MYESGECVTVRIVANSAVPWLGRGHIATEGPSNSAVCTAHIAAMRVVKKKNYVVAYDAVYSSRNSPRFGVAYYFILRVEQYLKMEAVIHCEILDFHQSCALLR